MKITETEMATVVLNADEVDCMVREYLEHRGRGDLLDYSLDDLRLTLKDPDNAFVIYLSTAKEKKNV